jgi:hypothetical protein
MRTFIATALIFAAAGSALAGCPSTEVVQVGVLSTDPEKETVGYAHRVAEIDHTGSILSSPRGEILPVGASMGEAEKDTLGYLQTASAQ